MSELEKWAKRQNEKDEFAGKGLKWILGCGCGVPIAIFVFNLLLIAGYSLWKAIFG